MAKKKALTPRKLSAQCGKCGGECCKSYSVVVPTPKDAISFDELQWFLLHDGCSVFVEANEWHVNIATPCRFFGANNKCQVYSTRLMICRGYGRDGECEGSTDEWCEHVFDDPQELAAYAKTVLSTKEYRKVRMKT